ncbi:NPC intracellular cholesterol transporter 2 homolog a [Gryllus bimaculatus]|nr:NPC intracellular cholesterol transporter 2 homolog a [Gryllus bimaculatus]
MKSVAALAFLVACLATTSAVEILNCDKQEDIEKLTNSVHANLLGVPFPFIGVDGTSACDSVFNADGSKAGCPLKKGQQYIYKHTIKVHDIYPKVRLDVHWALAYGNGKQAVCFEVPARIVS